MDGRDFDRFTQRVATATSRRSLLKSIVGGALAIGLGSLRANQTDAAACRAVGVVCAEHANCCSGLCGAKDRNGRRMCACPTGTTNCNGQCVKAATAFRSDVSNCGACGNRCPRTTCQIATCSGGVCGLAPDPGAVGMPCNDGNAGTSDDVCQRDGTCKGASNDCSHLADQCNDGVYDSGQRGCVKRPKSNGTRCDDGNACTQTDTCQNGSCVGSNPVVCIALDDCHVAGTCNPQTGKCSNPDAEDGISCNDHNACTTGDTCQQGRCTGGTPLVCDSKNPCIVDSCNPDSGCVQTSKSAGVSCADDDRCDGDEVCDGQGACVAGTSITCAPPVDEQCQEAGVCDPVTGICSYGNKDDGTICVLTDKCFGSASCQKGVCTGRDPVVCTARDDCHVVGVCDPTTGDCSNPNAPDGTLCNDQNACTTGEYCTAGVCGSGAAVSCNDGNLCTIDTCDPEVGCIHTPKVCDDKNACTVDTCDIATGDCVYTQIICDDGNKCTISTCDPVAGCVHTPKNCNDFNACTIDSCDPETGRCINTVIDCNDNNACTIDSCDPQVGCTHTPLICDDSNACTKDTCDPQIGCVYTPISCDDGDPCTIDTCDRTKGCVNTPVTCPPPSGCQNDDGICNSQTGECEYTLKSANTVCRAKTGACDMAAVCDGISKDCPPNAYVSGGTICRASAGVCDVAEACTGYSADCPANGFKGSDVVCAGATACQNAAMCSGSSATCPPRTNKSNGVSCNDGNSSTCDDVCTNGVCAGTYKDFLSDAANCGGCGIVCQAVDACTPARCVNGTCNATSNCTGIQTCGYGGKVGVCGAFCPSAGVGSTHWSSCPSIWETCTDQGMVTRAICYTGFSAQVFESTLNINSCASAGYVISNCGGRLTCGACP